MAEKSEFHGDVGQAVLGNVNEAPRLKNVVQLNIGSDGNQVLRITNLQRKTIAAKVKELMKLSGQRQLDIYAVILTEFGAENMDEFPRDRYKDAMALLDGLIAEAKAETASDEQQQANVQNLAERNPIPSCSACEKSFKAAKAGHFMTMLQTIVIVIALVILGRLIMLRPVNSVAGAETNCRFDGEAYSVGSTVRMSNGALRECLTGSKGGAPYWGMLQKAGR